VGLGNVLILIITGVGFVPGALRGGISTGGSSARIFELGTVFVGKIQIVAMQATTTIIDKYFFIRINFLN
jgi:hypothetical protein